MHAEGAIGDINLLMNQVSLTKAPFDRTVSGICADVVSATGGFPPQIDVRPVRFMRNEFERLVATWTVPRGLSMRELLLVELATRAAYQRDVSGHREQGGWHRVVKCRDFQDRVIPRRRGIYLGPEHYNAKATGVVVSRRFSSAAGAAFLMQDYPDDWLGRSMGERDAIVTDIVFSEGATDENRPGLSQERFIQLVTQISYLLATGKLIENHILMADIFRRLNKIGARPIERSRMYGMESTLEIIERMLLLPLRRPDLAHRYDFEPESILLLGVPGIGKTFLARYLMARDCNAIFVALDTERLRADLVRNGEKGVVPVFLRLDIVKSAAGLPVILLVDDIDVILDEKADKSIVAKFLSLMEGARERGFHIVASSNYPRQIDARLLEPGRLSNLVHVSLPNAHDRKGVLANCLRGLPFETDAEREGVIDFLVPKTEGWTQRYLRKLCIEAGRNAAIDVEDSEAEIAIATSNVMPLRRDHFVSAYGQVKATINIQKLKSWDAEIAKFVSLHSAKFGYPEAEDR